MKLGVVGLPNVGKSTLFNALTQAGAEAANYPFCTIELNVGVVAVPDPRLAPLVALYHPEKTTPALISFVDIAGLVRGASKGEGLGNQFLSHIREVDALVHVVRCFVDKNVTHVEGEINPLRDIEIINLELIFADMDTLQKRADKVRKQAKTGNAAAQVELSTAEAVLAGLEKGLPARSVNLTPEQKAFLPQFFLLTAKPVIYVANIAEGDIRKAPKDIPLVKDLLPLAEKEKAQLLCISAQIEDEIAQMPPEERAMFLEELGITESGLDRLIAAGYDLLGLMSYLTAGPKEVRAWTIEKGTRAPQAAGKIHSDFERGFIRAEVISFNDLLACGSTVAAKEKGLMRSEGKDYIMQDGDVVLFRFNV